MKKIIRLTENDLARIVRRVIRETEGESDLIGSTVNLYRTAKEKQEDFAYQVKITDVKAAGNYITVTLEGGTTLNLRCTDSVFGQFTSGSTSFYNANLYRTLKSEYCTAMNDRRGNRKTVPTADFASTGGQMGNVG